MSALKTGMLVWRDADGGFHAKWRRHVEALEDPALTAGAQNVEAIDFSTFGNVGVTGSVRQVFALSEFVRTMMPEDEDVPEIEDLAQRIVCRALSHEAYDGEPPDFGFWYFITQFHQGHHVVDLKWQGEGLGDHEFDEDKGTIGYYLFPLGSLEQKFMRHADAFCDYWGVSLLEDFWIGLFRRGLIIKDTWKRV